MKRIAVCNSACLIALRDINRLDVILDAFDEVLIPPEVSAEVRMKAEELRVRAVSDTAKVHRNSMRVHRGEAAAIALAMEIAGVEVILDDYKARQLAASEGLKVVGTVGLLLRAKAEGRIPLIRPILNELTLSGFRLASNLVDDALRIAGESE